MELQSDLPAIYKAMQGTLRELTGKSLPPLLKRWRNTRSLDSAVPALSPDKLRFLARLGLLDSGNELEELAKQYAALTDRISRSCGDAPGIVDGWFELFASGEYGVLEHPVCAPEPRCKICPLSAGCRYLASGGNDARAFGSQLGQELIDHPAGLRAADVLAFAVTGERAGASDISRAEAALKAFHGLRGLFLAPTSELRGAGFSEPAIARLQAIAELCRHWADERVERGKAFRQGRDFYDYFHLRLRDLKKEVFMVVMVDQKHFLMGEEIVSEGSLTETLVHPREVFSRAVRDRAAAIAVVHNHPSGDPTPSPQDRAITRRLKSAAELIGIRLLDHVIVGDGRYYSFVEQDVLE